MEISAHLQNVGVTRGSSEANVRKFCLESGINRRSGSLSESELNFAVETAVEQVRLYKWTLFLHYTNSFGMLDCRQCRA